MMILKYFILALSLCNDILVPSFADIYNFKELNVLNSL